MENKKVVKSVVEKDTYEIYNGDCLELMQCLASKSVDMVLCDLPYNVTKNKWDEDIVDLDALWVEYKRVIKDNGAILLFGQDKFTAKLMLSQPKLHRYNLIWDKVLTSGFLNANRMPLRSHEDVCVFYKKLPTYNPQMVETGKPNHSSGKKAGSLPNTNNNYGDFIVKDSRSRGNVRYPKSILKFEKPHPSVTIHPTQKPVSLLRYLVETYTLEGEVVLDNTAGSFSTGVACIESGRYFIGMEKQEDYFDRGANRLKDTLRR